MARTMPRLAPEPSTNGDAPKRGRPAYSLSGSTRRRPSWVLLGSLLVVAAALVGAWVFTASSDRSSIVVAAGDLQPGDIVGTGDLRVIEIGSSAELRAIQPSQQDLILGKAARGPIPAGTVLNTDLFADSAEVIPPGMVVAGVELGPGEVPVPGLRAGDVVEVLAVRRVTGTPASGEASPVAEQVAAATVWSVVDQSSTSTTRLWVSLLIPADTQEAVAQAAADGLLRLMLKDGTT